VILIIGGMGFIGMNTALRFLEMGEQVIITQHSANRIPEVLKDEVGKNVFVERMDVANTYDVFDVMRRNKVDSIVSFAAPPARGISPQTDYHIYTAGLQNILEAARAFDVSRVSLASSQSVYSGLAGRYTADWPVGHTARTLRCQSIPGRRSRHSRRAWRSTRCITQAERIWTWSR